MAFLSGEYERLLPSPDWRTLYLRYIDLAYFILFLGLPYSPKAGDMGLLNRSSRAATGGNVGLTLKEC